MSYEFVKYNTRKKSRILFKLIIFFIILILLASIIYIIYYVNKNIKTISKNNEIKSTYKKLFNEKNYTELIQKMDIELKSQPFNSNFLIYRGYSFFLLGENEQDLSKKNKFFYSSLFDLRKALAIGVDKKNLKNIYFCLGKLYFYLGESYYYQSLKYLNESLKLDNKRNDLYYILGILYSNLGEYDNAILQFGKANELKESDLTLLAIANTYYKKNDTENATKYLEKVINMAVDPKIKEKSYYLLGLIYFNDKSYDNALLYFNKVIDINDNNESAHFYIGEIYYYYNNIIKARSEWRKTLDIDPSHIKANKRLFY